MEYTPKKTSSAFQKGNLKRTLNSFSRKQTVIFSVFLLALIVSTVSILGKINKKFLVYLPERGGSLTEGVIGTPRFINPLLALSNTDRDLTNLVYSGLMQKTPSGSIEKDLAENFEISDDNLTYTFKIRPDATFQDGQPVTAKDVIFTIDKAKDSVVKSPLQAIWQGVSVEEDPSGDTHTVIFKLREPYAAFLENATIGIMPRHIWDKFGSDEFNLTQYNLEAVGSGPYKIKSVKEKKNGLVEEFELVSFRNHVGGAPFIRKITFKFFKNETELVKAYRKGRVDQISSVGPAAARKLSDDGFTPNTAVLSRVFGLFFNPNQNALLRDKNIVQAIEYGINKKQIVDDVLYGFGTILDGPIPPTIDDKSTSENTDIETNLEKANDILESHGWKMSDSGFRTKDGKILGFSISTADVPDLTETANLIKDDLAKIGIEVSVKIFETGVLNQNIIRPREYEALLFGQVIRNDSDLFAFWHSSQRNDPGLNIAVYTNSRADKILEELISTPDEAERTSKKQELTDIINNDRPAIFLYAPKFIYMESPKIKNIEIDHITSASERFLDVSHWYIRVDAVWKFLLKTKNN